MSDDLVMGKSFKAIVLVLILTGSPSFPDDLGVPISYGSAFGVEIGVPLPNYNLDSLQTSIFGLPFVTQEAKEAADQFNKVEVLVTPKTGTVLGVRAIAEFRSSEDLTSFGVKMTAVLSTKYGASELLYFANPIRDCPAETSMRLCPLDLRTDRYFRALPRGTVIDFDTYYLDSGFSAALTVVIDEDKPENIWGLELLAAEIAELNGQNRETSPQSGDDDLLKGLE